ncbi:MAG: tRNA 2-thiouridine synthesizing protein A [Oceanospirillaceae bacterium]|jgi:tRNA 2-thiouridine synthesizing protein A|tara:strand:- start:282 stop:539 length:258 start_codon:yes stop_codon:yes gene_type:complete
MDDDMTLEAVQWQQLLDTQGLQCPLPLLKAKRALSQLDKGEKLKVLATDAGSQRDFEAWTRLTGHSLHQNKCIDGVYHYLIEKTI